MVVVLKIIFDDTIIHIVYCCHSTKQHTDNRTDTDRHTAEREDIIYGILWHIYIYYMLNIIVYIFLVYIPYSVTT